MECCSIFLLKKSKFQKSARICIYQTEFRSTLKIFTENELHRIDSWNYNSLSKLNGEVFFIRIFVCLIKVCMCGVRSNISTAQSSGNVDDRGDKALTFVFDHIRIVFGENLSLIV